MTGLARRLEFLATVEIAVVLVGLVCAGALLGYGSYVRVLSSELRETRAQLVNEFAAAPKPRNAIAGGRYVAAHFIPGGAEIVILDANSRVVVFRLHRTDAQPVVNVRSRGDLSGDPRASGTLARSALGLATAFGLQSLHARAGALYVIVEANQAALVAAVRPFLVPLFVALVVAIACAFFIARALARQVTRPLDDVTAALARFASGDLTPHAISADERHELAPLAEAYNGAIAQMQRAFAVRDRANEAMRQFIADAGHQLRTPLTVVQGFIDILRRHRGDSAEENERILDTMSRQSRIMAALIDKLILLERWEHERDLAAPEPIDVGVLVRDLVQAIADAHPERRVETDADEGLMALIDPTELGYVVNNLVDNALKYTQGTISVAARAHQDYVVLEVADEGPGIPPAESPRIFDRFYRGLQRDVEGSGLGLAITKRAVERAHGTIDVRPDPSGGSRFTVRLSRVR